VLAERWRVQYNTVRPHSSLGYKPPAPAARLPQASEGHGKVESKERFPLFHTPTTATSLITYPPRYTNYRTGTKTSAGQKVQFRPRPQLD